MNQIHRVLGVGGVIYSITLLDKRLEYLEGGGGLSSDLQSPVVSLIIQDLPLLRQEISKWVFSSLTVFFKIYFISRTNVQRYCYFSGVIIGFP